MIQIIVTLYWAWKKVKFSHGDIHPNNIILREFRGWYRIGEFYVFSEKYMPILIDFESAQLQTNLHFLYPSSEDLYHYNTRKNVPNNLGDVFRVFLSFNDWFNPRLKEYLISDLSLSNCSINPRETKRTLFDFDYIIRVLLQDSGRYLCIEHPGQDDSLRLSRKLNLITEKDLLQIIYASFFNRDKLLISEIIQSYPKAYQIYQELSLFYY